MTQLTENKPRRRALIATLLHFCLIDRGFQLEIDLTNSESACSLFLIVAESRFSHSADARLSFRKRSPLFAALPQLEQLVGGGGSVAGVVVEVNVCGHRSQSLNLSLDDPAARNRQLPIIHNGRH